MTRGMQFYAIGLLAVIVFFFFKLVYVPGDVRALNQQLSKDEYLADYPYQFRVLRIENGKATMNSPRSASVSVPEIIAVIDPALEGVSIEDERYQKAQQGLADRQARAHQLVISDPDITGVYWELDEAWLRKRGVLP